MTNTAVKDTLKALDERAIEFVNRYALSGMSVGIVQDGKLVYARGFGLAEAKQKKPVTPETIFRIGSISKTFTAIAVMQLWEQGCFKLDDPVNQYLKPFQILHPDPFAPPITIRHMLTHTAGIGEMRDMKELLEDLVTPKRVENQYKQRVPSLDEYFKGLLVADVHPDKKWAYANNAYAALGQLIEDISGEPFAEYMIRHIFEPLGMHRTDYILSDRVSADLAQGYTMKKGFLNEVDYSEFPGRAAGTTMSSVKEMGLYLAALMNGGSNQHGSVLKPETLGMMMKPYFQEDPHLASMGLGFFLEDLDGHRAAWHGGALGGFNAAMWVAPEDKLGVVAFTNSNTRAIYHFGKDILRSLIGLPDFTKRLPRPEITHSPHLWKDMLGSYAPYKGFNSNARIWMNFGGEVEIFIRGSQLMLRSLTGAYKNGIVLHPVDAQNPLVFESVNDGKLLQLAFIRNKEGFIDHLSISALSFYTFYKISKKQSLRFRLRVARMVIGGLLLCCFVRRVIKKCRC